MNKKKSYKINNIGIICLYICCDSWWLSLNTSTYRLDSKRSRKTQVHYTMWCTLHRQSDSLVFLYHPQNALSLSILSLFLFSWLQKSKRWSNEREKNNNTNPHPKRTVYRCYCCSVDTFRWALCVHFIFALNIILVCLLLFLSLYLFLFILSLSHHFSFILDSKGKKLLFCALAHRLTEQNHWTINTNETENNNCYYLDIIFLRKKNNNNTIDVWICDFHTRQ